MTWSDRSALPARRWWDRAAPRHGWRGWQIPEDGRSFYASCSGLVEKRGMLIAATSAVKASGQSIARSKRWCFAWRCSRNNRLAIASRKLVLVFGGAVGRCSLAAADAAAVQRQPHALRRNGCALGAERA